MTGHGACAGLSVILLMLGLSSAHSIHADATRATEYEVKAAFLFNFAKFTQWPADSFPDSTAPLVIGVLGSDPFGPALEGAVAGKTVGGRPIAIRRYRTVDEVRCHVLYIGLSERTRVLPVLAALRDTPVLTVSDGFGPTGRGVMICFILRENRVRFEINPAAAERARLQLSSQLLRLALNIRPGSLQP